MVYQQLIRSLYRRVASDYVTRDQIVLPARHLRLGGKEFKDDEFFLSSARREARRLKDHCGFTTSVSVLDVGCGVGRLPIGLLAEFGEIPGYHGIDVDESCIAWCRRNIQQSHPSFLFTRIDVRNRRYNPAGREVGEDFRLPFDAKSFDIIYLYSVFSHMSRPDVRAYQKEFHRLLKPQGMVFLTAFVEEGVTEESENPSEYRMRWNGDLHCVRYEKSFFEGLSREQGFRINRFDYGQETDGQSAIYLSFA